MPLTRFPLSLALLLTHAAAQPAAPLQHGGKTCKTVVIGTQTWMAENLNYETEGSVCYDNNPNNCAKYGRLYNWQTAMKVCPKGWPLTIGDHNEKQQAHSCKIASSQGIPGAKAVYEELKRRFPVAKGSKARQAKQAKLPNSSDFLAFSPDFGAFSQNILAFRQDFLAFS